MIRGTVHMPRKRAARTGHRRWHVRDRFHPHRRGVRGASGDNARTQGRGAEGAARERAGGAWRRKRRRPGLPDPPPRPRHGARLPRQADRRRGRPSCGSAGGRCGTRRPTGRPSSYAQRTGTEQGRWLCGSRGRIPVEKPSPAPAALPVDAGSGTAAARPGGGGAGPAPQDGSDRNGPGSHSRIRAPA